MKSMPWFRMYCDFIEDPKILSLAFEDQRHFIGVLALKCAGTLDQRCEAKMLNRIVAQRLWISMDAIDDVKRRLMDAELIDDSWHPIAWNKRQFVSDRDISGAERQRRYRENHSNALRNVTHNGTVTLPDTETETDTESETDKNTSRASRFVARAELISRGVDEQLASDWLTLRKAKKAPATLVAINGIAKEARNAGMSLAEALSTCCQRGWTGFRADWVANQQPATYQTKKEINDSATLRALGLARAPSGFNVIEGETA